MPLLGRRSLLDTTLSRLRALAPAQRTWVVSAQELASVSRSLLRGWRGVHLLLEPDARDTAAAIAWAAAQVAARDPDALLGVFPADAHIPNARAFARCVGSAARAARRSDELVLVGVEPTRPDPAYGYIQFDADARGPARPVRRFVEKPSRARAARLLRRGDCLWNSGMVVARAARVLDESERHAPEVWDALGPLLRRIAAGRRVARSALARAYRRVRPIAFDRAVLERSRAVSVVRGRFPWSDLGSWDALAEQLPLAAGNRVSGEPPVVSLASRDNLVWNPDGRAVALVGVEGYVVVNTEDVLLVCAKERAQEVRRVVEELARRGRDDLA